LIRFSNAVVFCLLCYSIVAGFEDKPFAEFLKSKKLTDTVRHYVQRAIAMVPDTANTLEVTVSIWYLYLPATLLLEKKETVVNLSPTASG
jgi:hypothetical protein